MAEGVANWFRVCARGGRQIGLAGDEVELADFQSCADGCGEPTLGDIAGRIAQDAIVPGIRQPEIVLGIECDRTGENGAVAVIERDPFFRGRADLPEGIVGLIGIKARLSQAQIRKQLILRRAEWFAET